MLFRLITTLGNRKNIIYPVRRFTLLLCFVPKMLITLRRNSAFRALLRNKLNPDLWAGYLLPAPLSLTFILFVLITSCGNQQFEQGKKLYGVHCESCHQASGEGLAKLYPPLKDSDYWLENQDKVPCIIRYGLKDTILVNEVSYSTHMLPIPQLTDYEICNIMNYINQEWYVDQKKIEIKEIKNSLKKCK